MHPFRFRSNNSIPNVIDADEPDENNANPTWLTNSQNLCALRSMKREAVTLRPWQCWHSFFVPESCKKKCSGVTPVWKTAAKKEACA